MLSCGRSIRHRLETLQASSLTTGSRARRPYTSAAVGAKAREDYTQSSDQYLRSGNRTSIKPSLRKELFYLDDPLQLANHTRNLLQKNEREKALDLVRLAGKTKLCTVSWNHVIDHDISQGRIALAIKDYNEVSFNPISRQYIFNSVLDEEASTDS